MIRLPIDDPTRAGEARRRVAAIARRAGFSDHDLGRVGIVSTELTTNLAKHATVAPELLAMSLDDGEPRVVEVLSIDRGPGGEQPQAWLADGYTTAGSSGTGLGAVQRTADAFEMQSIVGSGTVILARIVAGGAGRADQGRRGWAGVRETGATNAEERRTLVGGVSVPLEGEDHNGDSWAMRRFGPATAILVADGLGHGEEAARASLAAVATFRTHPLDDLVDLLAAIDAALRSTRGAAAAVARIDPAAGVLRYAGIGNVSGTIVADGSARSLVSHNGTLGQGSVRAHEFSYPIAAGSVLVMHSDGARGHWNLDAYAGIARREPSLIAGVLYRDHRRGRDDVTIVVAKVP